MSAHKVFCIGMNKTGTESLKYFLVGLGYRFSVQHSGEILLKQIIDKDYRQLFELTEKASAFKDVPYNVGEVYKQLDEKYKNAKFILTTRSSETWFHSIRQYHASRFGVDQSVQSIKRASYGDYLWCYYKNFLYYDENMTYMGNKENMISAFETYNHDVENYFASREKKLLILDLSDDNKSQQICEFLDCTYKGQSYPYFNRT